MENKPFIFGVATSGDNFTDREKETERLLNVPVLFAGSLLVLIIPVSMFACFQDKFMNLSFGGGIKG